MLSNILSSQVVLLSNFGERMEENRIEEKWVICISAHPNKTFCNRKRKSEFLIGQVQMNRPCFGPIFFCLVSDECVPGHKDQRAMFWNLGGSQPSTIYCRLVVLMNSSDWGDPRFIHGMGFCLKQVGQFNSCMVGSSSGVTLIRVLHCDRVQLILMILKHFLVSILFSLSGAEIKKTTL